VPEVTAVPRAFGAREPGAAGSRGRRPLVSIIMASYEAEDHIEQALRSVLAQSLSDLEVIVCDDASRDGTIDRVAAVMRSDPRVKLVALAENGGPARARNRALDEARGAWVAIVDADDLLHPERLERLVAAAVHFGADIVADDLLIFDEERRTAGTLLDGRFRRPAALTPAVLVGDRGEPALGYLKPMIRRSAIGDLRYDETVRVGEDFDFLFRLILGGARAWLVPEPWYLYRRHAASISHRLSESTRDGLIAMIERLLEDQAALPRDVPPLLSRRLKGLFAQRDLAQLADALGERRIGRALATLALRPGTIIGLWKWLGSKVTQSARSPAAAHPTGDNPPLILTERALTARGLAVPDYAPSDATDWESETDGETWRRIAELALSGHDLAAEGAAGTYAMGFAPFGGIPRVGPTAVANPVVAEGAIA
jgi:succinoglycan biosynthesis protein ExoO